MVIKKLTTTEKDCRKVPNLTFDVVLFVDNVLPLVAKTKRFKAVLEDKKIVISINCNHKFICKPKFRTRIFRPCLARLAYMAHEKCGYEFEPYGGSFTLSLPMEADVDSQMKYLVTFENTSVSQWVEFLRMPK